MTDKGVKAKLAQLEKFKQAARELEADDSEEAFDRALKKVAKAAPGEPPRRKADRDDTP